MEHVTGVVKMNHVISLGICPICHGRHGNPMCSECKLTFDEMDDASSDETPETPACVICGVFIANNTYHYQSIGQPFPLICCNNCYNSSTV